MFDKKKTCRKYKAVADNFDDYSGIGDSMFTKRRRVARKFMMKRVRDGKYGP